MLPDYLMMDACDANYNAASACFDTTKILMCYFHLKQNVIKPERKALVPDNVDFDTEVNFLCK